MCDGQPRTHECQRPGAGHDKSRYNFISWSGQPFPEKSNPLPPSPLFLSSTIERDIREMILKSQEESLGAFPKPLHAIATARVAQTRRIRHGAHDDVVGWWTVPKRVRAAAA